MLQEDNQSGDPLDNIFGNMEKMKKTVEKVNKQMKNPEQTTFVAVCIPEFLSLYETERLVQELCKYDIDIHNIIVNQVLFPEDECRMCKSRSKMQRKYLEQILELYEDFHITVQPLGGEEVRGNDSLKKFAANLLKAKSLPKSL